MASADPQPFPSFAPNNACPAIVSPEDVDYLVDVLGLDGGKSESDLDDEVLAKAGALGIDVTSLSAAELAPTPSAARSTASLPPCRRVPTLSTAQSSATSHSSVLDSFPTTTTTTKRPADSRRLSETLTFSLYDEYLAQLGPNIKQPKFAKALTDGDVGQVNPPRLGPAKKKGTSIFVSGFMTRMPWVKRSSPKSAGATSCVCCRDEFDQSSALHSLPCGHSYCCACLRVMIDQAMTDETKMPPRCCTLPIPSSTLSELLGADERLLFLKAVVQFSTPWELRVFCPNSACGEFIPPRHKLDPKQPCVVVCRKCDTSACSMCKRVAHENGRDCPDDFDLDAVLKIGEKSGWRRCYRCRTLVELVQGCTHMTCRCKAQFCYICGAIWDPTVGCPNFCSGEEEMERRRAREEAQLAERAAAEEAEAAERRDAERRTAESPEFRQLRDVQAGEAERFAAYARKKRDAMWARQLQRKLALAERHSDQTDKMRERHAKTVAHLEDRQVRAEMALRETLEASERSVRIRLKYMEAYCEGLGRGGGDEDESRPARKVTERDLRELGQQYSLRDGMERQHTARINVLRDRQLKAVEELVERQEDEWARAVARRDDETEDLAVGFALEEDDLVRELERRERGLRWRWILGVEILRRRLGGQHGVRYAAVPIPQCRVTEWAERGSGDVEVVTSEDQEHQEHQGDSH